MSITIRDLNRTISVAVIPGGAAGAHVIDGDLDASGDTLLSVRHISSDLTTNADLTAEFSITGLNTIDNSAGTDTSGDFLVVTYAKATGE